MSQFATEKQALEALSTSIDPQKLADMDATLVFDLSGDGGGQWTATVADGQFNFTEGKTDDPTVTLEMAAADLKALVNGDLNPMAAFMQGRIKVKGDMSVAMRLQDLFG